MLAVRDRAACRRLRPLPDEHLSRLGVLLQPCGHVDGVAADHQLASCCGFAAGDHLARVDAHREGGPNRPFGVVLVCLGNAEHGEHCVAGELLCRAPEPLDLGIDQLEELSLKLADVLRIQPLAERGRPGEVGEENGYDPPFLTVVARLAGTASVIPEGDAAVGAEGRAGRLLESAGGASPLERCAALTAKTGARSVLGSAGGADQCHAASLRRPLLATSSWHQLVTRIRARPRIRRRLTLVRRRFTRRDPSPPGRAAVAGRTEAPRR